MMRIHTFSKRYQPLLNSKINLRSYNQLSLPGDRKLRVILVGWLGCTPRNLNKYAKWWEKLDISIKNEQHQSNNQIQSKYSIQTLQILPPIYTVIFPSYASHLAKNFVKELKIFLETHNHNEDKLVFHLFSGHAPHFYAHLLNELHLSGDKDILALIDGCITDSGPPYAITEQLCTRGFVGAILYVIRNWKKAIKSFFKAGGSPEAAKAAKAKSEIKQIVEKPEYTHWLLTPIVEQFFKIYIQRPKIKTNFINVEKYLTTKQPKTINQLIFFSNGDDLIPPADIEPSIERFKELGFPTNSHSFVDSPHVGHFLVHFDEYQRIVVEWVKNKL